MIFYDILWYYMIYMDTESDSDDSLISCGCIDILLAYAPWHKLSRIDLAKLRDDEAVKSHFKEATRWVQEVWSIQGMVRNLEKRISRYCDFGENWEAEKLFHAELSEVDTYCNKRSVAWEGLSEFHAWIYPSHQKSDNTLSTFRKGPLQIITLCGTGDTPNTCPSKILRPPQVMGKEVWDAEDFQVPESSPQWCFMRDEHLEKQQGKSTWIRNDGETEESTWTYLLVDIPMPLGKLEIHQFTTSSNPSSLKPAEWLRCKMHVDIHSTISWTSLLNTLVLIWKDWSNSCPCIFFAKTPQGFFLLNSCSCYFLPTEIPWA